MTLSKFMANGNYLPPILRDFHDQKDLFKSIWMQFPDRLKDDYLKDLNWVSAHVFTIDVFLWFMAKHGYTLQKCRHRNIEFHDINDTIAARMKEWKKPFEDTLTEIAEKNKAIKDGVLK
jgi:hypothetical protein